MLQGLFLALVVAVATAPENPASEPIYNEQAAAASDIRAALRQAIRQRKNVVLVFGANWCADCHALDRQMHQPALASLIARNYVVVKIDVGGFDKNVALASKYHVPLQQGIPAVAVLDSRGKLLHAQKQGEFADARRMDYAAFRAFFERWKPKS